MSLALLSLCDLHQIAARIASADEGSTWTLCPWCREGAGIGDGPCRTCIENELYRRVKPVKARVVERKMLE